MITASAITPDNSLEEFRVEFNKLIQDFDGVASGNTFTQSIIFEGATADAFETTVLATDPTADRTLTLPNVTGTVITTGNSADPTTTTTSSSGGTQTTTTQSTPPSSSPPSSSPPPPSSGGGGGGYGGGY